MKRLASLMSAGIIVLSAYPAPAQPTGGTHSIMAPSQIKWGPAPPSLPPGAQAAVLYGDPAKDGLFVLRLRLPAGYRIPPHTHPRAETVTVVSGAVHIGMGKKADPKAARRLPAGSFFAFDPGMAHYAQVKEATVVQLSSTGPWAINYVNQADDPRRK